MSFDVKGKYAIVTGAGSGINHAFAEQLLLAGCSVVFADLRLRQEAEDLIAKYPHPSQQEGIPSAVFHKCDQSDWASIADTWEFALKTFPQIDLLCPGAGIWEPPSSAFWNPPEISPLSQDAPTSNPGSYHLLAVNLNGPIRFAQIALDYWLAHKIPGNLLLVASMAAYLPMVSTPLYCASKGGLTAFALSLAQFKARFGIRVACMCPATTFTSCVLQDYCVGKVRAEDMNMTSTECAQIMFRLVTEEGYGNGDVVEGMQFAAAVPQTGELESGSENNNNNNNKSDVRVRTVPYAALMPPIDLQGEFSGKNILVREEELWEQLKTKGMRS